MSGPHIQIERWESVPGTLGTRSGSVGVALAQTILSDAGRRYVGENLLIPARQLFDNDLLTMSWIRDSDFIITAEMLREFNINYWAALHVVERTTAQQTAEHVQG
ncbi:hypothetical protein M758_8G098400 [Ceratodon purpureus]|nr:hypothetical protein M758_8G098400 [Ceratodon purpureus]